MKSTLYTTVLLTLITLTGVWVVQTVHAQSSFDGYVGEAGTTTVPADGTWATVNFERTYESPVVVGTTNTDNNGNGLVFESRNVSSSSAEVRICKSKGKDGDGCVQSATNQETVGYVVIDTSAANSSSIDGLESGSLELSGNNSQTVSYSKSFGSEPYVFTAVQTLNGRAPVETRVTDHSSTDFTVNLCEHETGSNDSCDSTHTTETVGWFAVNPNNIPWNETAEAGVESAGGSNWTTATFSESYSNPPTIVVENITTGGGQEVKIDEARNVTTADSEVRFCELEGEDNCDSHNTEEIAWTAVTAGSLSIGDPTAGGGGMSSGSYAIARDSLNTGGLDTSTSSSYSVRDTVGEQATGRSTSSNYTVRAGYRQMAESNIAISSPGDIDLGNIGGVTGGTAEATQGVNVITDSPSGYKLAVKTETDPAMQNTTASGSFADYDAGTDPDYSFSIASSESAFGFSPEGPDITDEYRDDGSSCNTGSQDTQSACWRGLQLTDETVAQASDNNQPSGATTTLRFRAESGTDNVQTSGSYQATITVTGIAI